jgi:hypothetical protein
MSHIVSIQTQVRDPIAVAAACERLQLPPPSVRTVQLFSSEATGLVVELPGWRYPVVCHTDTGTLEYDNFSGRWGDEAHLQKFLQRYATEKVKCEARRAGYSAVEQLLSDGSIRIQIAVHA